MAKYYRVPRFLKIQKIDDSNKDRVDTDWIEVNADGSEIVKSKVKTRDINEKDKTKIG